MPEGVDDSELERRLFTPPTFEETPAKPLPDWSQVHREPKRRGVTLLLLSEEYRAAHGDGYGYSRYVALGFMLRNRARAGELRNDRHS